MNERDLEGWTLVFDLDGTLVDSAPDLIGTLNRLLVADGHPTISADGGRHLIGHGVRALLRHGFAEVGETWEEARRPELFDRFLEDYRAHIAEASIPYEGVVATLDHLAARGAVLCVATNKRTDLAETLITALGLRRHFARVAGPELVSACKPDAAHILETIAAVGGDPQRSVMVGDASPDTKSARAAGVPCLVCSFGYNDRPAAELGGHAVIAQFADMVAVVTALTQDQAQPSTN